MPDVECSGIQLGLSSASDIDNRALAREPLGRRQPDPGIATRHEYDLPGMFDGMNISIL